METALMSFGRKAAIAAVAFATVGSTLFGGVALAGDDKGNGRPPADDKKVVKVHKGGDAKGGDGVGCVNSHNQKGWINVDATNVLSGLLWGDVKGENCTGVGGDAAGGGFSHGD
jgi:hypothetical protein